MSVVKFVGSKLYTGNGDNDVYENGTLVWSDSHGLRLHDGSTVEGNIVGATGYAGSQGDIGYTGSEGIAGATGYVGSEGPIGFTGSVGTGYTGSEGGLGYAGSEGAVGFTGSAGTGGGSYDQSLNTTDNVVFNMISSTYDINANNYVRFRGGTFIGDETGASPAVFRIDTPLSYPFMLTVDSDIAGNNYSWTFGTDSTLSFPGGPVIIPGPNTITIGSDSLSALNYTGIYVDTSTNGGEYVSFYSNTVIYFYTDTGANTYAWQFNKDGSTNFPNTIIFSNGSSINKSREIVSSINNPYGDGYKSGGATATVWTASNSHIVAAEVRVRVQSDMNSRTELFTAMLVKDSGHANITIINQTTSNTSYGTSTIGGGLDGNNCLYVTHLDPNGFGNGYNVKAIEFDGI